MSPLQIWLLLVKRLLSKDNAHDGDIGLVWGTKSRLDIQKNYMIFYCLLKRTGSMR